MTAPASLPRPRVLVISASPIGEVMSGPAIRAYEFARALEPHAKVTLAATEGSGPPDGSLATVVFRQQDPRPLRPQIAAADAVISQPPWPLVASWARRAGGRLIYDMYSPEPLEWLAYRSAALRDERGAARAKRSAWEQLTLDRVIGALKDADHLLCASEKQRDLWIGAMLGERLISDATYRRDPSLRSLIDTAPFGLPADPPRHTGSGGIWGRFPQIADEDEIVLWNGGIWSWLDAPTVIRAMVPLLKLRPRARLVFIGQSSELTGRSAQAEARELASRLDLLDRRVFFNDGWVPYEERADWLLEADCAASAHTDNLETRFAFRTRLLDCFWAGLPVACTEGRRARVHDRA